MKKIIFVNLVFFQCLTHAAFTQTLDLTSVFNNSLDQKNNYQLLFVGDASIQKSFNEGKEVPANAGLGIVFIKNYVQGDGFLKTKRLILEATINIASTVDTIKANVIDDKVENVRDYGNYVVNPYLTGQSASLRMLGYFEDFIPKKANHVKLKKILRNDGYEAVIQASNRLWQINSDSSAYATAMAIKIGLFWEFIPEEDYRDYSIRINLFNISTRLLLGDITQKSNLELRNRLIGTEQTGFIGWEPSFHIRLKNIKAEFSFPIFYSKDNVKAISSGQFATSIGFSGGFSLSLNGKPPTKSKLPLERDR